MALRLLYRLGANVHRSWRIFALGLALAALAGLSIYYGYYNHFHFQTLGLVILVPAVLCTAYGYLGILANRWAQIIEQIRQKRQRKL